MDATIDDYLIFLAPEIWCEDYESAPGWPGDVFAIAASLLKRSGAYIAIAESEMSKHLDNHSCESTASEWIMNIGKKGIDKARAPKEVRKCWNVIASSYKTQLNDIKKNKALCNSLIRLCCICDETFVGIGVTALSQIAETSIEQFRFAWICYGKLSGMTSPESFYRQTKDMQSTLCHKLNPSRVRVLPKAQTPTMGLSMRSLTHYICLCPPEDVQVNWNWMHSSGGHSTGSCNVLLIPWPFAMSPSNFSDANISCSQHPDTRWFQALPSNQRPMEVRQIVENLIEAARNEVGDIDMMIFPECALTEEQFDHVQTVVEEQQIILISGVIRKPNRDDEFELSGTRNSDLLPLNCARVCTPGPITPNRLVLAEQRKHHRWKLDKNQIVTYGLSSKLDPELTWWEGIAVDNRELNIFTLREWLVTCPLICEDLARIEPVGPFVRAVAPDLVVALLLDGPQLKSRWSANNATVLTDDPGSSVLTLTSLGMVKLSRPVHLDSGNQDNVIALWRDMEFGSIEIKLPADKQAAVLSIARRNINTKTADGRKRSLNAGVPVYGGICYV